MQFWRIEAPPYSDYHRTYINGDVEYSYGLPGIECDLCGQTWASGVTVLPYTLVDSFDPAGFPSTPVSPEGFRQTCERLMPYIANRLTDDMRIDLPPGGKFLPAFVDVPSRPRASFLWGGWSPIVTENIKEALVAEGLTGCEFFPVVLRSTGAREAKLPPPIPRSGEPEDIMKQARVPVSRAANHPKYFHLVVTASSEPPKNIDFDIPCSKCGFQNWSIPGDLFQSRWYMSEDLWRGTDFFHHSPSTSVVVTDRVRTLLQQLEATNVAFEKLPGDG